MSLWTNATLGVAAVVACAGGAVAQTPGCSACNNKSLPGPVANKIPYCSKHDGLAQFPLSEKRYIKQFCNPTICPNSCFGYFKPQWTSWGQACPGWGADDAVPHGTLLVPHAPPAAPTTPPGTAPTTVPPTATPVAPEPKPVDPTPPPAPPSKPLELPPSKPADPKLDVPTPQVPMPTIPMPPTGVPGGRF